MIEAEVDTRRTLTERDRLATYVLQDEKDYHIRIDDLARQRRQVLQMREELKEEMLAQEKELRLRLEAARDTER